MPTDRLFSMNTEQTTKMLVPTEVKPLVGYRMWVRFSGGVAGEADLSHLVGSGVFKAWDDRAFFEQVRITEDAAIGWGDEIEICPDRVYFDLTGKTPEEMMPGLRAQLANDLPA